jgi:hypothetical protein
MSAYGLVGPRAIGRDEARRQRRDLNAEARIQAGIVEFVRAVAPRVIIFHIPNGGLRSKAEAARMRWTGVLAGALDLVLVLPAARCAFWETKTDRGRLSGDQKDFIARLEGERPLMGGRAASMTPGPNWRGWASRRGRRADDPPPCIPSERRSLLIYDGRVSLGAVSRKGAGYLAIDQDGRRLGLFSSLSQASAVVRRARGRHRGHA